MSEMQLLILEMSEIGSVFRSEFGYHLHSSDSEVDGWVGGCGGDGVGI